jgi:hypothetical protein
MQVVVKTWAVADMRAVVMQRLHIGDERPLDLRPALVAFVVERPRHRGAGLPFAQSGKSVAVSCQDLIAGGDS